MSSTSEESNEEIRELNRLMFGLRSPSQTGKSLHSPIRSDVSLEIRKKRKRPFVKTKTELERIYGSSVNTNTQAKSSKISNRSTHRSKRLQEPVKSSTTKQPKLKATASVTHEKDSYSPISCGSFVEKSQNVVAISASLLRKLFSKVAFSYSGNFEQHLYALLRRGGATHYTTTGPAVTHFIVCAGADDFVVKNVKLWYEDCIQFVQPDWVYECIRKEKLLGPESDNTSFDGETTIQLKEEGDRYVCRVNECDVVPNDASLQVFEESTLKDQREKPELMVFEGDKKIVDSANPQKPKHQLQASKHGEQILHHVPSRKLGKVPSDPKTLMIKNPRPGEIGLKNFGNTCFMNSGLQCLLNTPPLIKLFHEKKAQPTVKERRDSTGLVHSLQNLFHYYWNPNEAGLNMQDFVKSMQGVYKDFDDYQQHDCQEFLLALLSKLDEKIKKALGNDRSRISQIIPKCFQFMIQSELTCSLCNFIKKEHQCFSSVPLSFPPAPYGRGSPTTPYDIYGLLTYFVNTENLDKDNCWQCSDCGLKKSATRSQAFCSLPNYLVIHLKRFAFTDGIISKLRNSVTFPIDHILDMTDFIHPDYPKGGALFKLYGCVCHFGGITSGHYTSYVKHAQTSEWHYFNDDIVTCEKPDESVFSSAYVLFYANASANSN